MGLFLGFSPFLPVPLPQIYFLVDLLRYIHISYNSHIKSIQFNEIFFLSSQSCASITTVSFRTYPPSLILLRSSSPRLLILLISISHRQPLVYFLSLWICLFWAFYINRLIQCICLCDWFLSLHITFSWFIHVVACNGTSLYCWIQFHCVDISCFICPFIHWWIFCCFCFFLVYTAMNICVQGFVWTFVFISLG